MNPQLEQLVKRGKKKEFIDLYKSLNASATQNDAEVAFEAFKNQLKGIGTTTTGGGYNLGDDDTKKSPIRVAGKGLVETAQGYYQAALGDEKGYGNKDTINKILELLKNEGLTKEGFLKAAEIINDQILQQLKDETELRTDINKKTSLTGELSEDLRKDMVESSINAAKFGITLSEIGDLFTNLVDKSGKFSLINKETIDKASPFVTAFDMSMTELGDTISTFEKVGYGANTTIEKLSEAGIKSISLGLSGKKTIADITTNIGRLNEYGFQKGIQGLAEMTRKAIEFKISMSEVFTLADKVMNPEGALDVAANLQVLGGAMGDFANPLRMMYDATNNVEGLQDALIGAASSLATYNQEQGRFEVTGLNLRRAREMATALGVDFKELTKSAIASSERMAASTALMSTGLQMKDEDKEFLTNLSSMEGGQMVIKVPESIAQKLNIPIKVALDKLDANTANALLKNREAFKEMTTEDLAMNQLNEIQKISRDMDVITAYARVRSLQVIKGGVKGLVKGTGFDPVLDDLKKAVTGFSNDARRESRPNFSEKVEQQTTNFIQNQIVQPIKNVFGGNVNPVPGSTTPSTTTTTTTTDTSMINYDRMKESMEAAVYGGLSKYSNDKRPDKNTVSVNVSGADANGYFDQVPVYGIG